MKERVEREGMIGGVALLGWILLIGYVLVVGVMGEQIGGVRVKSWHIFGGLSILGAILWIVVQFLLQKNWMTSSIMTNTMVLGWSLLFAIGTMDVAYTIYGNATFRGDSGQNITNQRIRDEHIWYGELSPRVFQPTEWNFVIHKPEVHIQGETFGEFYEADMLNSPTLRESVLELRSIAFHIDKYGFREETPLSKAEVLVLGDSFVYGYGTTQKKTWVELLEATTGTLLYNLGVSSTGPGLQIALLQYVLGAYRSEVIAKKVFWMIYEGNDLENRYVVRKAPPPGTSTKSIGEMINGTVFQALLDFPKAIKKQSVWYQLKSGKVQWKGFDQNKSADNGIDPYRADGIRLKHPLYFSQKFGYRLFNPQEIERVGKPESYVREHPNRRHLDHAFQTMKALSQEKGFEVIILLAPCAARAYGRQFDMFPALSDQPYFLNYVEELAEKTGFRVINLLSMLSPYFENELLYYRDDHHWNERGNLIVANLLRESLFSLE